MIVIFVSEAAVGSDLGQSMFLFAALLGLTLVAHIWLAKNYTYVRTHGYPAFQQLSDRFESPQPFLAHPSLHPI